MLQKQSTGPITKRWCSFKVCSTFFLHHCSYPYIMSHSYLTSYLWAWIQTCHKQWERTLWDLALFSLDKRCKAYSVAIFFSFFGQLRLRVWSWLAWWICCLLDMMIQPCYYHEWFQLKARLALSLYGHRDRRELPMRKHKLMWKGTGMASNQKHF